MSEENIAGTTATEQPNGGEDGIDYKAKYEEALKHSREWEKRAKANRDKAKAYDEAEAGKKTVEERLAALEGENANLKAAAERAETVKAVAKQTGVPESVVAALNGADAGQLAEQAKAIAEAMKPKGGAPVAPEAGKKPEPGKPSKKDILSIKDAKERKAAIADNIELFQ